MINGFKHKGLEKFFLSGNKKGINAEHSRKLELILDLLNSASAVTDMNFPGSGLHKLEPKKDNRWVVKVSGNWRLTFVFDGKNSYEVDYVDYH